MLSLTASPLPMRSGCCFPSLLLFPSTAPNEVLCPHPACLSLCCQLSFPAISDFPVFSTSLLGSADTLDVPAECFLLRVRSKYSNFRVGDVMFLGMALRSQEKMLPLGVCSLQVFMTLLFRKAAKEKVLLKRINKTLWHHCFIFFPSKADTLSVSHKQTVCKLCDHMFFAYFCRTELLRKTKHRGRRGKAAVYNSMQYPLPSLVLWLTQDFHSKVGSVCSLF